MPYPEALIKPMRAELTRLGFQELTDAAQVRTAFEASFDSTLLVVNSVCGCAAANARPAVAMALQANHRPTRLLTVFAGQDMEATTEVRTHLAGIPPSSPFIVLFEGVDPVFVLERRHIEGRSASAIAIDLAQAFERHASLSDAAGASKTSDPDAGDTELPSTFRSIL